MIGSIRGKLLAASPLSAVIEAGGLGFEVHVPITTAERLPKIGSEVLLHTHAVYREDAQSLFGFTHIEDRDFFRLLVNHVSGVGPKVALALMSRLSLEMLESAILTADSETLSKCPGIGRKTAERIVLDLKDRLGPGRITGPDRASPVRISAGANNVIGDAISALMALGYKLPDAEKAVRKAHVTLGDSASTEALIKKALA